RFHAEDSDWSVPPFDFLFADIIALELVPEQLMCDVGAGDLAGDGYVLESDGDVPGVAHERNCVVLDFHDRRSGVKCDPRLHLESGKVAELLTNRRYFADEPEACVGSATGRVLVGDRVSEAHKQPLLIALHDRPVGVPDGPLARLLKRPKDLSLILGFEAQVRLGLKQVTPAHQNGHLSALGLAGAPTRGSDLRRSAGTRILGS